MPTRSANPRDTWARPVSVAIGCTGGHHRSVAIVEELTRRLADDGVLVNLSHRDLER